MAWSVSPEVRGTGLTCTVRAARSERDGSPVAAKRVANCWHAAHEIDVLSELDHPNVIRLLGVARTPRYTELYMPLAQCDLHDLLGEFGRLEWEVAREVMADILGALAHVHARGYIHGDVKPANIVLSGDRAILIDFGLAREAKGRKHGFISAAAYRAPEVILGDEHYDCAADVWALGCVLSDMSLGASPFHYGDPLRVFQAICATLGTPTEETMPGARALPRWGPWISKVQPPAAGPALLHASYPAEAHALARAMLLPGKEARATARECLAGAWLGAG